MTKYNVKTSDYGVIFVTPKLTSEKIVLLKSNFNFIREILKDAISDESSSAIVLDLGYWQKVEDCKKQIIKLI